MPKTRNGKVEERKIPFFFRSQNRRYSLKKIPLFFQKIEELLEEKVEEKL